MSIGISISDDDVLYIADTYNHCVVVVNLSSISNVSIIGSGPGSGSSQFDQPFDVAVRNATLYILDVGNHRIQKRPLNGSNSSAVSRLTGIYGSFYFYVDNDHNIYLSQSAYHRVLLFLPNTTTGTIVAGTGVAGSNTSQLSSPYGIFVNQQRTIYIADCHNHRIMKWSLGASEGIIVAGNGTVGSSLAQVTYPTQVIVDTNGYIYISESGNSRITRWKPNSTFGECIAACTGGSGNAANQIVGPHSLALDSYGSLYVNDRYNYRIQKFQILSYNSKYSFLHFFLLICLTLVDSDTNQTEKIVYSKSFFSFQMFHTISQHFVRQRDGIPMQRPSPMLVWLGHLSTIFLWISMIVFM